MDDAALARAWLDAAREPVVAAELEGVYAMVGSGVATRGPACWASGRCCNFERAGHRLYTTGLEAAYTVARLPVVNTVRPAASLPILSASAVREPVSRGGCPFQAANLCGVHGVRPLGCRVYFCDRSAQEWQRELSERSISLVRTIHDRHAIEYRYAEWRGLLALLA